MWRHKIAKWLAKASTRQRKNRTHITHIAITAPKAPRKRYHARNKEVQKERSRPSAKWSVGPSSERNASKPITNKPSAIAQTGTGQLAGDKNRGKDRKTIPHPGIQRCQITWEEGKVIDNHMGVSKKRGTPKLMVYNGNPIKMDDLGVPLFSVSPIWQNHSRHPA